MKIQVRKCGFSGRLFESEADYLDHLVKLRRTQRTARRHRRELLAWQDWLSEAQHSISTIDELQEWLNSNQDRIQRMAAATGRWDKSNLKKPNQFRFNLKVDYSKHISNSHSAPRSGVENWRRDANQPTGYPGWLGQIHVRAERDWWGWVSDLLKAVCVHTGSGGGGWQGGQYEVTIWEDDWPGLATYRKLGQT